MSVQKRRLLVWVLLVLLGTGAGVLAEEAEAKKKEKEDPEDVGHTETVVVTASRTAQPLDTVQAAISVVTGEQLENSPAESYGDVLRTVPGVNVSQMSARDIQVTSRGATNSLATSQLVLLDNRSLYLDFFGFVMWDFAPMDPHQIKQIEVVRGPGSAVWGANAMTGVINILTKSPKENPGTTIILGGGRHDTLNASVSHAGVAGNMGYRVDASYYQQDPFDRPTGIVPGSDGPFNPGGTPYPDYENQGTSQPKVNLRFDWDTGDEAVLSVRGGWAGTDGIIHTGIGPFAIEKGTSLSYVSAEWQRRAQRISFFINDLDGEAPNLLTVDATTGLPILFTFESQTYNLDYTNTTIVGGNNVMTYGGNVRRNEFDLSIAPMGDARNEVGVFFQNEMLFGDNVRWLLGARVDDLDPIDVVVSPRTSLLYKVKPNHTLRFSYNRAFRSPSMVQNFLDIAFIPRLIPLPTGPFPLVSVAKGNPDLTEEQLDAIEIGYVGRLGNTDFTASIYRNETSDSVDFYTACTYSLAPPPGCPAGTPPGWPLPTAALGAPPLNMLPSVFSYRNIGEIVDQGVELSVNTQVNDRLSFYVNYSWQDEPDVTGISQEINAQGEMIDAVNQPPTNRANAGIAYNAERWYVNGSVNYQDEAFWTDVLDSSFWGPTESFTTVNMSVGRHVDDNFTVSLTLNNMFDDDVQQHVFGDLLDRRINVQMLWRY